ncbi:DUF1389 domain-containing protein [Chlamydia pecorum]|uniref:DUF1389 domain-containing protein n=1 Tax=Chlamydia pecorum TaxID=85991 RepID=UPI00388D0771
MSVSINIASNSVFKNNDLSRKNSCLLLAKIAVVVAIVLAAILAVACLMSPISYIVGGTLGIAALAILAVTLVPEIKRAPKNLPQGFLNVVKSTYPDVVYNLLVKEHLTLSEFRAVLNILENTKKSGDLESLLSGLPEGLARKILRFGVKNLEQGVQGVELQPLEPFLRKHCPFYMLNTLINMGNENILRSRGCDDKYRGCYWLGAAALCGGDNLLGLFDLRVPNIMKLLDKKDFDVLKQHASSSVSLSWNSQDKNVQEIISKLADKCKGVQLEVTSKNASLGVQCLPLDKEDIGKVLHRLCWVGYSWEQLQLVVDMDKFGYWPWFCFFDGLGRMGKNLCFVVGLLCMEGILDETSAACSPEVLLMTLDEIKKAYDYGQSPSGSGKFGRQTSQVTENMIDYLAMFLSPYLRKAVKSKDISQIIDDFIQKLSNIE